MDSITFLVREKNCFTAAPIGTYLSFDGPSPTYSKRPSKDVSPPVFPTNLSITKPEVYFTIYRLNNNNNLNERATDSA